MISEKEVQKLRDNIKELEEENTKLREEKEKINQEKEKLEKEFEEFKAKHTQTVAELRKALKIKANKTHESKPVGAKLGHQAYTRHIPARIDCIKEHKLSRCPECNTKLGATQEIRSRYVTDVKLVSRVKNTQHNIHRKYCPTCKKIVEPDVPNVLPHARFGLNLMLLVMYLRLGLRLPGNKVREFLQTMYNLSISEGEIVHVLKQLVIAFGPYYSTLEKMRKRNNSRVPLSVFGTKQKGMTLVIDRHSALRALAEKACFLLQLCWSHILTDSKDLAKNFGDEGKYVHQKLKWIFEMSSSFQGKGMPEQVDALKAEIFTLTLRHYKHITIRRFVDNLWKRDIECLFRFVIDPEIDSTNNISERELRHLVIIRKISNGSRSPRGAHATAMLLSVIQTLRMNKQNTLMGMQEILKSASDY